MGEINMFRIWRTHRHLFRDSNLRLYYAAALLSTLMWMFSGLTILNL